MHLLSDQIKQLETKEIPNVRLSFDQNGRYGMASVTEKYQKSASWAGVAREDLYYTNVKTGQSELIKEAALLGRTELSPGGKYLAWWNVETDKYEVYNFETKKIWSVSDKINTSLTDELNDQPQYAYAYGTIGWSPNDEFLYIADRYDIWRVTVESPDEATRITKGRETKTSYSYVHLDYEDPTIKDKKLLLSWKNEISLQTGYSYLTLKNSNIENVISGDFEISRPTKAEETEDFIFTKMTFTQFPELYYTGKTFKNPVQISNAGKQQEKYQWGTVELIEWTSLDGQPLRGLLYKPSGFDPKKKYPMITNFYERSSHNMHRYWGIVPHRSTVNPAFYTSRGYLVFVPDIPYRIGYPGESCYNAVIPGVTTLIDKGFVDKERIGVQGHSWGGYQIAYLITKTDIFKAAISGAPVVNMISAYGGIRWGSGMSRMFQYEHTQSRIGGTLWEKPLRYLENSPIFTLDKVNTPVLILHNDQDGAVPWYQGIEMFVGLRRLEQPAWMLNYNNEPHWPTSWQNIRDYNIRMQQFMDHYLKDEPMPVWMSKGVPAVEQGKNSGLELEK